LLIQLSGKEIGLSSGFIARNYTITSEIRNQKKILVLPGMNLAF
jgi:hypothetical protein